MFGAIKSKLGYETLPTEIAEKSFYELKAQLPGKEKFLDFVSSTIGVATLSQYAQDTGLYFDGWRHSSVQRIS